jgi:hypothetical protein
MSILIRQVYGESGLPYIIPLRERTDRLSAMPFYQGEYGRAVLSLLSKCQGEDPVRAPSPIPQAERLILTNI